MYTRLGKIVSKKPEPEPARGSQPIRILHVFSRLDRGGAELRTLEVLRNSDPSRFEQHFCSISGIRGALDEDFRSAGGHLHQCPMGVQFPIRFFRLLRAHRIDVVHSHVFLTSGIPLAVAALAGVKIRIAHFRSSLAELKAGISKSTQRAILHLAIDHSATRIVAVSKATMESAWGPMWERDHRCRVVYNGISQVDGSGDAGSRHNATRLVRDEFRLPANCTLIVHVGNLRPPKNHRRLLRVFSAYRSLDPTAHLLLIGKPLPPVSEEVRSDIRQLGLEGGVTLVGERTDARTFLLAADALVFPSLWEGLPGVVLEALQLGTPVIASDIPVTRELMEFSRLLATVSLAATDMLWANTLRHSIVTSTDTIRSAEVDRFRQGPFDMLTCVDKFATLWSSR
jgi:glycosyltransferase involved in cell wall biosynthesis